jgi:hypothetical protein
MIEICHNRSRTDFHLPLTEGHDITDTQGVLSGAIKQPTLWLAQVQQLLAKPLAILR